MDARPSSFPRSRIEHVGPDRTSCGYCRKGTTSHNYGIWAHQLDVSDYQQLLDAGWRRSGSYLYRPNLQTTCCPTYVIRLDAMRFVPSTTHKRVLKRLRRFTASPPHHRTDVSSNPVSSAPLRLVDERRRIRDAIVNALWTIQRDVSVSPRLEEALVAQIVHNIHVFPPKRRSPRKRPRTPVASSTDNPAHSRAPDLVSNVALMLAAAERKPSVSRPVDNNHASGDMHRRRRAKDEALERQTTLSSIICANLQDHLRDLATVEPSPPGFLNFYLNANLAADPIMVVSSEEKKESQDFNSVNLTEKVTPARRPLKISHSLGDTLEVSDVTGKDVSMKEDGIRKMSSTQSVSEESSPTRSKSSEGLREKSTAKRKSVLKEFTDGSGFSMELVPSQFEWEVYEIFRKYQIIVHRDNPSQCGEDAYRRFLIDTPLIRSQSSINPEHWYGSFHMLYRISGKLFAVGVVDLLPRCLSSVYLFYDPDFAKLSPGTLSALKEIEWVRRVGPDFHPSLRYYYMGYYIHSCPKMRYKRAFHPSEILCEVTKNWIPASDAIGVLSAAGEKVLRLAPLEMPNAPLAGNFNLSDFELDALADESKLQIDFAHDGVRIVSLRSLDRLLGARCADQLNIIRKRLRGFVRLVGKTSAPHFVHIL